MPKTRRALWILSFLGLASFSRISCAQSETMPPPPVEYLIHAVLEHGRLGDEGFLADTLGLRMRVVPDGSGDLRGVLLAAPPFALASGFAYSVRRNIRSMEDEIRLSLYFRQCPDEARFIHDWKMPLEHLQLGDGSGSLSRYTPANDSAISFALIYHTATGICEGAFTQQVLALPRPVTTAQGRNPALARRILGKIAVIMRIGDLRKHAEVAAKLDLSLREIGFHRSEGSSGNEQLMLEQTAPGIDAEYFSYAIQDSGWQTLYPFATDPEILVNRNVALHIPIDTGVTCIGGADISPSLHRTGLSMRPTRPGRNVLRWDKPGNNSLTLTAVLKDACVEAFDLDQITDTAHALPETTIFRLPGERRPVLGPADRALVARVAYRLHNEPHSTLDFIVQLPGTAQVPEFERMDAWIAALRKAFAQEGIPEEAMEFHLYPPATAGTPPRVFLMALRSQHKCNRPSVRDATDSPLPSALPCH